MRRWCETIASSRLLDIMTKTLSILLAASAVVVASAQPRPRSISEFFDGFTAEWMRANPNLAASTRYFSGAEQDAVERQLAPETPAFRRARAALAQKGLEELAAFDRASMTDTERVSADVMQWQLGTVVDADKYSDYFFPLEQFAGVNVSLPNILVVNHPLNVEKDAVHYISRLEQVGTRMDEAVAEALSLAEKGMIPPRFIIRATIAQMQQFIATEPAMNPLVDTFSERLAASKAVSDARRAELQAHAQTIVAGQVYPAWRRALALLQPLVARANDDAGLWRFKGGAAAYAHTLRRYTTTRLTADQIHAIGLKRVAEIEQQMNDLFRQIGRTEGSINARVAALQKQQAYPLTEEGRTKIMARRCSSIERRKRR
jgi:uncharacterized protein (DUF885 family)